MPLSVGEKLGPYEILSIIGKGGMGEVYRCHDPRLNRDVAIKVSAERFSERFDREARAIAALNHPNICTLFDVGPNYLVMEFVDGEALNARIKKGAIPLEEALEIAAQVMRALEEAHGKLITHRDLKPGNVMVKPDGVVKVLDFGLAKFGGNAPTSIGEDSPTLSMAATQAGVVLGTAAYMAPEQARGRPVDKRADIWAFGVLLHEMVTGRQLFRGEDLTETMAAVVMKEPDLSEAPERVRRALTRCLVKDPNKRLRDISGVELLLEPAPSVSVDVRVPDKPSRLPWVIAVGGLAAATVAGFLYLRQPAPATPEVVRFEVPAPDDTVVGTQIRVSPDGRRIAFSATGGGHAPAIVGSRIGFTRGSALGGHGGRDGWFLLVAGQHDVGFSRWGEVEKDRCDGRARAADLRLPFRRWRWFLDFRQQNCLWDTCNAGHPGMSCGRRDGQVDHCIQAGWPGALPCVSGAAARRAAFFVLAVGRSGIGSLCGVLGCKTGRADREAGAAG